MWATMASVELIGNFRVKLMNNSKIEQITLSIRKIKQMRREKSPFSERTFLVFQCIKKKIIKRWV